MHSRVQIYFILIHVTCCFKLFYYNLKNIFMDITFTLAGNCKKPIWAVLLLILVWLCPFQNSFAQTLPVPSHIIILIEENHADNQVLGNSSAPYINQLTHDSNATTFINMFAIEHPSQPNYLDFFSGSNQGITSDALPTGYPYTTANLARELLDNGRTFVTYSQDLPAVGSDIETSGSYARKHNPVTNWVGTGTNQVPDTLNQPFTAFPTDFTMLPAISYVVPNLDSDMHNGTGNATIAAADFWFKEHLQSLINWVADPNNNALFIYTFDEDDYLAANNIPTVFYGPMVKGGNDSTTYTLYGMLRTFEDMYGLGHAGAAATAIPITDCWRTHVTTGTSSVSVNAPLSIFPNPVSSTVQFSGDALSGPNAKLVITDVTGRQLYSLAANGSNKQAVNVSDYASGLYFYSLQNGSHTLQSGKFIVVH